MKSKTIRIIVAICICVIAVLGFALHFSAGNLSAFGWRDISLLCPLGALSTLLASKTIIPRAVIGLVIGLVLILVFGRLFCGWICPVPVVNKIPKLFKKKENNEDALPKPRRVDQSSQSGLSVHGCSGGCASCASSGGCASKVAEARATFDSRHLVLLGALLSATVFGFPVFCLICPIGLTFGTLFLIVSLFAGGDLTWGLIIVPVVLLVEVVFFKKWCAKICPLGALMSLVSRANKKVLQPVVDTSKCLESDSVECGRCGAVCEVGIDPRHPMCGTTFNECIKCRACVDVCPAEAIKLPLLATNKPTSCGSNTVIVDEQDSEVAV
jgi:ferredoxin-type protein NapH